MDAGSLVKKGGGFAVAGVILVTVLLKDKSPETATAVANALDPDVLSKVGELIDLIPKKEKLHKVGTSSTVEPLKDDKEELAQKVAELNKQLDDLLKKPIKVSKRSIRSENSKARRIKDINAMELADVPLYKLRGGRRDTSRRDADSNTEKRNTGSS